MQTLRSLLEEKIQNKHLLNHSFYKRWQLGQLSKEELQGYAKEYYAFEKEFPRFISSIHSKCEKLEHRQKLLENLIDEERGENNHIEMWLRFAEGLGLSRDEMHSHFHSDETQHLLRFRQLRGEERIQGSGDRAREVPDREPPVQDVDSGQHR
jgi:pyrroloquinoline-quinone synthase